MGGGGGGSSEGPSPCRRLRIASQTWFHVTLDGGYFYTTSEAEKASIAQSYPHLRAEGISFYVPQKVW